MKEKERKVLTEFIWDYIHEGHIYISKIIISGIYVDKMNPKFDLNDIYGKKRHQKYIQNKICSIFTILRHLGIIENFSNTTIRVKNMDKLNEIGIDKLLEYNLRDFQNYKKHS